MTGTIRAALLATLFLVAWNALFVFVMDEGYRHDPARFGGLIISCVVPCLLLAALPILVLSPVLAAAGNVLGGWMHPGGAEREKSAPGVPAAGRVLQPYEHPGGADRERIALGAPAAAGAGVAAFLVAMGILGTPIAEGSDERAPLHALDLILAIAIACGAGTLAGHLAAVAGRSPDRAKRIRLAATLVAAGPCSLAAWEVLRDQVGPGGSVVVYALTALFAVAGGLAASWAARGLLTAASSIASAILGRAIGLSRRRAAGILVALLIAPAAVLALLAGASPERAAPAAGGRPNVLLLVADTLRADHIGCYGAAHTGTPNIDALASRGARVESVIAAGAWTAPTTASILTGLHPNRHGLLSYHDRIRDEVVGLAELFGQAGYATAGFSANPILSPRYGFGRGFDVWDENLLETGLRRHPRSPLAAALGLAGLLPAPERFLRAGELFDHALDWIDRPREKPFFLYLQIMDAHDPYDPPPPFDTLHARGSIPGFRMKLGTLSDILAARLPAGRAELDRMLELYAGAVSYIDDRIGSLMGELSRRGILDDTLVVFTFDHGEEFLDHGDLEHTRTLYEEIVRGPLIFAGPGVRQGHVIRGGVPQVDIAPTILDGAGLSVEKTFDGRSLWPALSGAAEPEPREAYMSLLYHGYRAPWHAALSLLSGDVKIIGTRRRTPDGERWAWELFDLAGDPAETRNLSEARAADLAALRERLESWEGRPQELGGALPPLDSEVEQRLRTLGYVD